MNFLWHQIGTWSSDIQLWVWEVIHTVANVVTSPFIISAAIDTGKVIGVSLVIVGALMTHPRTRRVTVATVRYVNRHSPSWAKYVLLACGLVPGQADEFIVVAILLVPILRNGFNRRVLARTIRYAWNAR